MMRRFGSLLFSMTGCSLLCAMVLLMALGAAHAQSVDPTTLNKKVMVGYQGWFTAPGDDNSFDLWIHWTKNSQIPDGTNINVEMYPDLSEFDDDELFETAMTMDDGAAPAYLYSGRTQKTIRRHVKWMKDYGIDGVFAQRFVVTIPDAGYGAHFDAVLQNLRTSCQEYGRVFAVMYDVSGADEATFWDLMRTHWMNLVDSGIATDPRYLKHGGKPVVGIWGFGFKDGVHPPVNPAVAQTIINWFRTNAPAQYRATVFGGVPGHWRDLGGDSRTDRGWSTVYRSFDVISPWTVGRYKNLSEVDSWKTKEIVPDLSAVKSAGRAYSPVIWPGFSWYNLAGGPKNQIPRLGGNFFWRQAYNAISAGAQMLYVAMFDEVDEATAIYKVAPTADDVPDQGYWLTLTADGYSRPSDWYLRLSYEIGRMLRRERSVTSKMPSNPGPAF